MKKKRTSPEARVDEAGVVDPRHAEARDGHTEADRERRARRRAHRRGERRIVAEPRAAHAQRPRARAVALRSAGAQEHLFDEQQQQEEEDARGSCLDCSCLGFWCGSL